MEVTDEGMEMEVSEEQNWKALLMMAVTDDGIKMEEREVHE